MDMSIRFPNLQTAFGYVPKSFRVFGYEITVYGILLAVALLLGLSVIVTEAKRKNQNQNICLGASLLAIVLGLVGARIWYVAAHWNLYQGNLEEILNIHNGGFGFYGALPGGLLALWIVAKLKKQSFGEMADTVSIGLISGQILSVWGTFFSREAFGEYTDSLLAMELPLASVHASDVTALMRENLMELGGVSYIRAHPLFLYESLWCLALLLFLLSYKRRKRFSGETAMVYLAGYGFGRFFISWLRTDEIRLFDGRLAVSQIISAVLFVGFSLIVMIRRSMAKKRADMRRRRREKVYEEEERREAELARAELAYEEALAGLSGAQASEKPEPQDSQPEGSAEESETQPEAGQTAEPVADAGDVDAKPEAGQAAEPVADAEDAEARPPAQEEPEGEAEALEESLKDEAKEPQTTEI